MHFPYGGPLPSWPISHPRLLQSASPLHACFPSPGLAPAPPAEAHCPLTRSLAPQACPQRAGPQGCPPFVPVFHVPESSSEGRAHEGVPCGAPQGREGCKVQARVGPTGSGNVPVPMCLSHGLSSFPLPFRQSLVFATSMKRAHALSLLLSWCSLPRREAPGSLALLGAWLELTADTTSPGVRGGDSRQNAGVLCAALRGVPERPCLPTGMGGPLGGRGGGGLSASRTWTPSSCVSHRKHQSLSPTVR